MTSARADGFWSLTSTAGRRSSIGILRGCRTQPPFASLLSSNGRFYTCAGPTFLEFDVNARAWTFHGVPAPTESCYTGSAFADGPDGLIYAGSHPHCHLISFDPKTRKTTDYGAMDSQEQYLSYLALDSAGWAYCGIGTAQLQHRRLQPDNPRAAADRPGRGAETWAPLPSIWARTAKSTDAPATSGIGSLKAGPSPIAEQAAVPPARTGAMSWGNTRGVFPDGQILKQLQPARSGGWRSKARRRRKSSGSRSITSPKGAESPPSSPDPMAGCMARRLTRCTSLLIRPTRTALEDYGPVARVGGGNFCAMAVQGKYIAAPSYSRGIFHLFDTRKPFNGGTGDDPNPRELAAWPEDICRPRAALAHPDGRHVLMAGYAGYGRRGGGLGICDLVTGKATLITHTDLIPDQSTITLQALPNGDLIGGTSVETPGGGHPTAREGVLYIMDWKTHQVVFQTVPVPGAREVFSLEVGQDGLVYGLASGSEFFVFDPPGRKVVHRENLSAYGGLPRPALVRGADGKIYALFTRGDREDSSGRLPPRETGGRSRKRLRRYRHPAGPPLLRRRLAPVELPSASRMTAGRIGILCQGVTHHETTYAHCRGARIGGCGPFAREGRRAEAVRVLTISALCLMDDEAHRTRSAVLGLIDEAGSRQRHDLIVAPLTPFLSYREGKESDDLQDFADLARKHKTFLAVALMEKAKDGRTFCTSLLLDRQGKDRREVPQDARAARRQDGAGRRSAGVQDRDWRHRPEPGHRHLFSRALHRGVDEGGGDPRLAARTRAVPRGLRLAGPVEGPLVGQPLRISWRRCTPIPAPISPTAMRPGGRARPGAGAWS